VIKRSDQAQGMKPCIKKGVVILKKAIKILIPTESNTPIKLIANLLRVNLVIAPLACALFVFAFNGAGDFWFRFWGSMIISVCTGTLCLLGGRSLEFARQRVLRRRLGFAPASSLIFGFSAALPFMLPGLYLGFQAHLWYRELAGRPWVAGPRLSDYSVGIMLGALIALVFFVLEVLREQKRMERANKDRLGALETERLKAEVGALSAQLNPHFLFNSLNTIAATIPNDPQDAEDMVVCLADLYRSILKAVKKPTHSLAEELGICGSYLAIEKIRFGSRVEYEFLVEPALLTGTIQIPVLLLQPLVENAIKHGLAPKAEGGRIELRGWQQQGTLFLKLTDNGLGNRSKLSAGEGTGITNCRSRLQMLFGAKAKLELVSTSAGATISIEMPLGLAVAEGRPT
jgi:two-component system LytT family sensor kinase